MKKMLIGSTAWKLHRPEVREPHDVDYFSPEPVDNAEVFWHPSLINYPAENEVATLDELYTIKVSHSFWYLRNWNKHMHDIFVMQNQGAVLVPEFFDILYPIWEEHYGKKKVNLNVSAEDFFNKRVERVYDHDSIHRSIAYHDRPLYERILRDGHDVAVDKSKFDALDYQDKLRLVREEVYATALERQIIPSNYKHSPRAAYDWALRKTITDFSKGWFPLFIVDNFVRLCKPDINYVQVHKDNSNKLIKL